MLALIISTFNITGGLRRVSKRVTLTPNQRTGEFKDVITVVPCKGDETDNAINHGSTLIEIGGFVRTAMSSDPVGILITLGVYGVTHENDIQWILERLLEMSTSHRNRITTMLLEGDGACSTYQFSSF